MQFKALDLNRGAHLVGLNFEDGNRVVLVMEPFDVDVRAERRIGDVIEMSCREIGMAPAHKLTISRAIRFSSLATNHIFTSIDRVVLQNEIDHSMTQSGAAKQRQQRKRMETSRGGFII